MIIEKHFTLNKNRKGLDHSLSADPSDLKICDYAKSIKILLEKIILMSRSMKGNLQKFLEEFLFYKRFEKNHIIKKDIIIRRPQNKIKPEMYYKIVGKK